MLSSSRWPVDALRAALIDFPQDVNLAFREGQTGASSPAVRGGWLSGTRAVRHGADRTFATPLSELSLLEPLSSEKPLSWRRAPDVMEGLFSLAPRGRC